MRITKLTLCAAIALASAIFPIAAAGQTPAAIDRIELGIWPEYDRPAVLYLYVIHLAGGTTLPTTFSLPIPAPAGAQLAVAKLEADGKLYDTPYTRNVQGNWATISVQTDSLTNQIEYYGDLSIQGQQRDLVWSMEGGPAIGDLTFKVQQPVGASGMTITPVTTQTSTGSDGLTYYSGDLGALAAGSTPRIEVAYTRTTTQLTSQMLPTSAPTSSEPPISPASPAKSSLLTLITSLLPWILGVLGVVLLAVGGIMVFQMRRPAAPARVRKRPSRQHTESQPASGEASPVFCHQCGSRADASDLFCRRCGTRLRT